MRVEHIAAKIQAEVTGTRDSLEEAYERLHDSHFFWCFIDLADSSNFRLFHGAKEGYIRAETFFETVGSVVAPYSQVKLVKEIGDAVLLASQGLREILESLLLVDQVVSQLAAIAGSERFPFAVRGGISSGAAKRLARPHDDFVGNSIDLLARVMGVRSETANLYVHEDAYRLDSHIFDDYQDFLSVSEPILLPEKRSKGMLREIYYRELRVDRSGLVKFEGNFLPWKDRLREHRARR